MKKPKAKVVVRAMKQPADLAAAQTRLRAKNEGKTTVTAPAPFLPPTDSAVEQHFTPAQVAQQWGVSARTVQRLFASTPGVLKLGTKGKHVSLRIPARLLKAHYTKLSALRVSRGVRITKSGGR
jgi:transcriptional regulator GlxA family with amidase domain